MIPMKMLPDEEGYMDLHSRFPVLPLRPSGSSVVPVILMINMSPDNLGAHLHVKTLVEKLKQSS